LQKELGETKEKLKVITQKFVAARKERDQLKQENKELQEEVLSLQSNIRNMVPCFSNTSSAFPMQNELQNIVSEFYKCDCQDVFFDLLCPELNLDGVVFFYQNTIPKVIEAIERYFLPVEAVLKKVSNMQQLDGPVLNVLRKTYQSNWKSIHQCCLPAGASEAITGEVQKALAIGDEAPEVNAAVAAFVRKAGEVAFQMQVSDPPLAFDTKRIGEKVLFNSFKYESIDGFIKSNEECLIILPSVHKFNQGGGLGEVVIKANVLPLNYEFP
jgi:FtsZ-binding cell division protein ZapB